MELKKNYNINDLNNIIKLIRSNITGIKNNNKSNKLINDKLIELITKMVNPDPYRRYQNIDEVIKQIDSFYKKNNS
jgi:serine/threonine protein kinase